MFLGGEKSNKCTSWIFELLCSEAKSRFLYSENVKLAGMPANLVTWREEWEKSYLHSVDFTLHVKQKFAEPPAF